MSPSAALRFLRRRPLLIGVIAAALATAVLAPFVAQRCIPVAEILRFELAGSDSAADSLAARLGRRCVEGERAAGPGLGARRATGEATVRAQLRTSLWRDFLLIPSYTVLLVLCCLASARVFGTGWWTTLARRVAELQIVAGALDVVENVSLLRGLDTGSDGAFQLAQLAAGFKLPLLALGGAVSGAGAVAWLRRWRRGRRRRAAGAPSHTRSGSGDAPATLHEVLGDELEYLSHHRHPGRDRSDLQGGLVGLAVSGGGIRAATTSLGILQAMSRLGVLPMVDYISSVSGGGYIGASLSSYLSLSRVPPRPGAEPVERATGMAPVAPGAATGVLARAARAARRVLQRVVHRTARNGDDAGFDQLRYAPHTTPVFSTRWRTFPFRGFEPDAGTAGRGASGAISADTLLGTDIVAHLRTHGEFLVTRRGWLRRHAMRAVGTLVTGVMYSVGLFTLTIIAATALYLAAAHTLAPRALDSRVVGSLAPSWWGSDAGVEPATTVVGATGGSAAGQAVGLVDIDSVVVRTRTEPCDTTGQDCVTTVTRTTRATESAPQRIGGNFRRVLRAASDVSGGPLIVAAAAGAMAVVAAYLMVWLRLGAYIRGSTLPSSSSLEAGESAEDRFERGALWLVAALLGTTLVATVVILRWSAWGAAQFDTAVLDASDAPGARQALWLFVPLALLLGARLASGVLAVGVLPSTNLHTRRGRSLWGGVQAITMYGWWAALAFAVLPLVIYGLVGVGFGELGVGALGSLLLTRLLAAGSPTSHRRRLSLSPGLWRAFLGVIVCALLVLGVLLAGMLVAEMFRDSERRWPTALGLAAAFVLLGFAVNHNVVSPHYFYRDRLAETYLHAELPDTQHRLHRFHDVMEMPLHYLHGIPIQRSNANNTDARPARNTAPYHLISAAINLAGSRDLTRKDRKSGYWLFSKLYCGSTHTGFRPTHLYRRGETKLVRAMAISGAAASSAIGVGTFFAQAFATVLFNIRLGYWLENPRRSASMESSEGRTFWPYFLWKELVMDTTEHDWLVNVSDGGHTGDNVGIYPLLQRRCKVVIAVDAERDPALTFGSFTEALRHAYVDLGVSVDIDLAMLRPDAETGLSRSHCAIGRIHYPDRPDQHSYLVYLKNSLTGDEQEPVLNYKQTCPDFPHESTVDQFFDDAQFESYRALGVHIAEHAFSPWAGTSLFDIARRYHEPTP